MWRRACSGLGSMSNDRIRFGSFGAFAGRAVFSGVIGTASAALIYVILRSFEPSGTDGWATALALLPTLWFLVFGLAVIPAIPSMLLVGIPLTWPVRFWIVSRPVTASIIYAFIGGLVGYWVDFWVYDDRYSRESIFFGSISAVAWIIAIRRSYAAAPDLKASLDQAPA